MPHAVPYYRVRREYCNPFSVEHPVFTRVISKTLADEVLRSKCGQERVEFVTQMDAVLAHDPNGDVGVRWDVQVGLACAARVFLQLCGLLTPVFSKLTAGRWPHSEGKEDLPVGGGRDESGGW